MKNIIGILLVAFAIGNCQGQSNQNNDSLNLNPGKDIILTFEGDEMNKLPTGWSAPVGNWSIANDNGNKVLYQSAANSDGTFNIAVYDGAVYTDMEMSLRIKAISGKGDQGGGLVWRYLDKSNYYTVRENPLEDNVVLYKVENGKRTDLPLIGKGLTYGTSVPKLGNGWNNLKVVVKADLFVVYLNDKEIFQVKDHTFTKPGLIGVWSKADAASYFDDLTVQQTKK